MHAVVGILLAEHFLVCPSDLHPLEFSFPCLCGTARLEMGSVWRRVLRKDVDPGLLSWSKGGEGKKSLWSCSKAVLLLSPSGSERARFSSSASLVFLSFLQDCLALLESISVLSMTCSSFPLSIQRDSNRLERDL